jgi:hypothetical protein
MRRGHLRHLRVAHVACGFSFIMENGAKGCEVTISGKLRGARAKAMKFRDGYMVKSGNAVNEYVDSAVRHILLKQGVLGIRVRCVARAPLPAPRASPLRCLACLPHRAPGLAAPRICRSRSCSPTTPRARSAPRKTCPTWSRFWSPRSVLCCAGHSPLPAFPSASSDSSLSRLQEEDAPTGAPRGQNVNQETNAQAAPQQAAAPAAAAAAAPAAAKPAGEAQALEAALKGFRV